MTTEWEAMRARVVQHAPDAWIRFDDMVDGGYVFTWNEAKSGTTYLAPLLGRRYDNRGRPVFQESQDVAVAVVERSVPLEIREKFDPFGFVLDVKEVVLDLMWQGRGAEFRVSKIADQFVRYMDTGSPDRFVPVDELLDRTSVDRAALNANRELIITWQHPNASARMVIEEQSGRLIAPRGRSSRQASDEGSLITVPNRRWGLEPRADFERDPQNFALYGLRGTTGLHSSAVALAAELGFNREDLPSVSGPLIDMLRTVPNRDLRLSMAAIAKWADSVLDIRTMNENALVPVQNAIDFEIGSFGLT